MKTINAVLRGLLFISALALAVSTAFQFASAQTPAPTDGNTPSNAPGLLQPKAIQWGDSPQSLNVDTQVGQRFTFSCTKPSATDLYAPGIRGTDLYTGDSSICNAAVHAGAIHITAGGMVTIEIKSTTSLFKGSSRNGLNSGDWDEPSTSYLFVAPQSESPLVGGTPIIPTPTPQGVVPIPWGASPQSLIIDTQVGMRFAYVCAKPSATDLYAPPIRGTDLYTGDSSICNAAVHAGAIPIAGGGAVTIEIQPSSRVFKGTSRNGLNSGDWDEPSTAFVFIAPQSGNHTTGENPPSNSTSNPSAVPQGTPTP
jgi:hypothetical protein